MTMPPTRSASPTPRASRPRRSLLQVGVSLVRGGVLLALLLCLVACSATRWYVVRHAERLDASDDPPLSEAGRVRAQALAGVLSDKGIGRIVVSEKRRTQETAAPTAALLTLTPLVVPKSDTSGLIAALQAMHGENVLVVRHSEELHLIVNALSPDDTIGPIGNEYDNLFVVTRRVFLWQVETDLQRLKYGGR